MFLIRWSVWGERLGQIAVLIGIVSICAVCSGISLFTYRVMQPLSSAQCNGFEVKVVEVISENGPKRELVYEVQEYVSPKVLEPRQYLPLVSFPHKAIGSILGQCDRNRVSFTAENLDGTWDTYRICIGDTCPQSERVPVRINVG